MLKLNHEEYLELIKEIYKYDLEVPYYWSNMTEEEIKPCYNGAGADSNSKITRWLLTSLLDIWKPSILIHDVEYEMQQDTKEEADRRFFENNRRLIDDKVSTWNIFYKCYIIAMRLISRDVVVTFGQNWVKK